LTSSSKNLLALWPIARVYTWEQGLLIRRGLIREELPPGLHWRWWFVDEIKKWPSNEIALDLETGTIVTSDGKAVSVSANVSYRMISIAVMYRSVWHAEKTLGLIAVGHIASDCAAMTWPQLRKRRSVEANLLVSLNSIMAPRGIEVLGVRLTDCVPSRAYRHYHDGKVPV
jgi:regulator of protease activity HflC (stomatin/prohibitin superfamily)